MATREENLKKINTELEQLSDEELESIAGGMWLRIPESRNRLKVSENSNANLHSEIPQNTTYGYRPPASWDV